EVGPPRRAARLGVVVGEQHALGSQLVEVRRLPGHDAAVVGADVEPADIIAHDYQNVRLLALWWLLRCFLTGLGHEDASGVAIHATAGLLGRPWIRRPGKRLRGASRGSSRRPAQSQVTGSRRVPQ